MEEDGSVHDPYRIAYLRDHIAEMRKAVDEGVDLIGYTAWGCIDLVSVSTGEMKKRYGFIYVDCDDQGKGTLARSRKELFLLYKKVIASNGEDLDYRVLGLKAKEKGRGQKMVGVFFLCCFCKSGLDSLVK